jgi:hypothetical protein
VAVYPAQKVKGSATDCEVEKKETIRVPDLDKKTALTVAYKSENLYAITGDMPKGASILLISQNGAIANAYYLDVK